ncbi:WD40-repeat-containing domain protein [Mycena galericulata]|nr:WD40-repeat-containing domain protein [Mycena galericulata]
MTSSSPVFRRLGMAIKGHTHHINTIAFSPDGRYLASGADDTCLFLYHTDTFREMQQYRATSEIRVLAWHPVRPGVISCGLKNGVVMTIMVKKTELLYENTVNGPIHCMTFDTEGKHIAVGFANRVLIARMTPSSWTSERYVTSPVIDQDFQDITRSVDFQNKDNIIITTYLRAGIVGETALSPSSRLLAASVLRSGFQWFELSNLRRITTTTIPEENFEVMLPVLFIDTSTIVVGSSVGNVSIFKAGQKDAVQVLKHDSMVQALAYHRTGRRHFIVTGTSEAYDNCVLTVWTAYDNDSDFTNILRRPLTLGIIGAGVIAAALVGTYGRTIGTSLASGRKMLAKFGGESATPVVPDGPIGASATPVVPDASIGASATPVVQDGSLTHVHTHTHIVTKTVKVTEDQGPSAVPVGQDAVSTSHTRDADIAMKKFDALE